MPSNLSTTFGSGDAVAAQWQYNMNNMISWAQANNIPTSRLTITEHAITGSSIGATDPIPGSGTGAKYDPGWDNTYQAFYEICNAYGIHGTAWAGGSEWRVDLRNWLTSDGNNHTFDYRSTSSSIILNNKGSSTLLRGVNIPGAEFSDRGPNGSLDKSTTVQPGAGYFYPLSSNVDMLTGQFGLNYLRLAFRMERVQPTLKQPLDAGELAQIDRIIEAAAKNGATILLDLHNYARYDTTPTGANTNGVFMIGQNAPANHNGQTVGGTMADCFADFWTRMAQHVIAKGYTNVQYDISNEPHDLPGGVNDWQVASRQIVEAIRVIDQNTVIAVEGYSYASVASWSQVNGSTAWFTETIPFGQRNAGQARNTDPYLWFNGHCYPDAATNGYDGGFQNTYAEELTFAQNQGFTSFTKSGYTFPTTGNTLQTGLRSIFKSTFTTGDYSGTYDAIRKNSNTVTMGYTGDPTFTSAMLVQCSATSDEGDVYKALSGNGGRQFIVDFKIPTGNTISNTQNFAISHFWTAQGMTDVVEIRVIGVSNTTGYQVGLTVPSGSYTFVNSSGTTLNQGTKYTLKLVMTDSAINLYIDNTATPEATISGTYTNVLIDALARGKFYGTSYTGSMLFANENDGNSVSAYAPPNGGAVTYVVTSPPTTGPVTPITSNNNLLGYLATI